jgi:Kef-type K+ transport system membrane component KefB
LIGPSGFSSSPSTKSSCSRKYGIVILLFTVGLEFSLANLRRTGGRS